MKKGKQSSGGEVWEVSEAGRWDGKLTGGGSTERE